MSTPVGKIRRPIVVILLSIVTIGIYSIVWQYKSFREMKDFSGTGIGGALGLVLAIFLSIVNIFVLPSEVGGLYARAGQEKPVSGKTGFWILLPIIGGIVWIVKVQRALNRFWESQAAVVPGLTALQVASNLQRLEQIVDRLPEATRVDIEAWGGEPTFRVGGKNFIFASPDATTISVKLPKEEAVAVIATDPQVTPTGYGLGRHGWVSVALGRRTSSARWREVEEWIRTSYTLVAPKRLARQVLDHLPTGP